MRQLEMIKAFGMVEGLSVAEIVGSDQCCITDSLHGDYLKHYNPIADLALNCAARDKYEVEVRYYSDVTYITCGRFQAHCFSHEKHLIPEGVIATILQSKGLYK